MPIKTTTSKANFSAYIKSQIKARLSDERILYWLSYAGESLVNEALATRTYEDQTGNLSSSLGYAIVKDGKVQNICKPRQVKNGADGVTEGQAYLERLAQKYNQSWVLIVSAGMNYAAYVEARGKVVLSNAELEAPQIIGEALRGMLEESELEV